MNPSVSAILIVKNEATTLATCLRSIADLVGEIIVMDTGSTDGTREVALAHGARVFDHAWCDSFAAARNECLKHAAGDSLLWVDADEYFDEANRQKLRALLAGLKDEKAAYVMTQRSLQQSGAGGSRVQQVRLFRRHPAVGWEYRVHEQLLPSLRRAGFDVRFTGIVLEHTGYQDPALRRKKLARNLHLLELDRADRPDDAFTLFNLGLAYGEVGRGQDSLNCLKRSLERCHPGDSIVPKLYAALVQAHFRLNQPGEAAAVCRSGRVRCPDNPELLMLDGVLRRSNADLAGAENCWKQVIRVSGQDGADGAPDGLGLPGMSLAHFIDVDEGLVAAARQELAALCQIQGRFDEAEQHWKTAAEQAGSVRALCGLGELYLGQARWEELENVARRLDGHQPDAQARETGDGPSLTLRAGVVEALLLRGRGFLARKEFAEARARFEAAMRRTPLDLRPRLFLTHVLLQEDKDHQAAEQALRGVVVLDPSQVESWRNLAVLLRGRNRLAEATVTCQAARGHCPNDPELLLLHGMMLLDLGDLAGAEAALVRTLEVDAADAGLCEPKNQSGDKHRSPKSQSGDGQRSPKDDRRITARHNLALVYQRLGRVGEAEAQWRAVLAEKPDLPPAWIGLAELCLMQNRLSEAETILGRIEASANGQGTLLRARLHLERKEFAAVRRLLNDLLARQPQCVPALRLLSYALLQENTDLGAAEDALAELLTRAPTDAEARHNLHLLRQRRQQTAA